jgi:hypothetical protein
MIFQIEAYVILFGETPAGEWLDSLSLQMQQKFATLFARMGDQGKIWN